MKIDTSIMKNLKNNKIKMILLILEEVLIGLPSKLLVQELVVKLTNNLKIIIIVGELIGESL